MDNLEIQAFLQQFGNVEISNVNRILRFSENKDKENLYFLGNVKDSTKRNKDLDIIGKNYFFIDIDLRANFKTLYGDIIDDELLDTYIDGIKSIIDNIDLYNERSYIVNSGNGLHIYYIGDTISPDIALWSAGYSYIIEDLDKKINEKEFAIDKANKNIARICRIPGSINFSRKEKYGLEPKEVIIRYKQENKSRLIANIYEYGKQYLENEAIEKGKAQIKISMKSQSGDILDAINNICLSDIVCSDYGLELARDGKNFVGQKKGYEGMFIVDNILYNIGSHYLARTTKKGYNTFLYIKDKNGLDDHQTYEWFKQKYSYIKDLDKPIQTNKKEIDIPKKDIKKKEGFLYGPSVFDDFQCAMSGELVTVVAKSNSGKTTFAMDMITVNSKRKKKGFYINLEFSIEIMRTSRRAFINKKTKNNFTDIDPLTYEEQIQCDNYVQNNLNKFDYYNKPNGIELEDLIKLIIEKSEQGYSLFIVDTFSKITGNLQSDKAHSSQNKTMERMQELCQKMGIVVVLLHHTNKAGEFEGSQKIMDLSNVFITITRDDDAMYGDITKYALTKDKFVNIKEIGVRYDGANYERVF